MMTPSKGIGRGKNNARGLRGGPRKGTRTWFVDAKDKTDITVPIYRVLYQGEMLFCESSAKKALTRLPTNPADWHGWTIEARVDFKTWTCWPPEKVTRPKEDKA